MTIRWSGNLQIRDGSGRLVTITSEPRDGTNRELQAIGKSFGVKKLDRDQPHWSEDDH